MQDNPSVVMVVDDDPLIRAVCKSHLEEAGYSVIVVENGAAALRQLRKIRSRCRAPRYPFGSISTLSFLVMSPNKVSGVSTVKPNETAPLGYRTPISPVITPLSTRRALRSGVACRRDPSSAYVARKSSLEGIAQADRDYMRVEIVGS